MDQGLQLTRPQRVTVVDSVMEQIFVLIQNGTLRPGDQLPSERKLVQMLGVSRSTIREVLKGLAGMNLIEGRIGEGTFVRKLEPPAGCASDIASLSLALQRDMRRHVNEARRVLEREIASLAAERINDRSRRAIEDIMLRYDDDNGWDNQDALHLTIAEAAGNPMLVRLLQALFDSVPRTIQDKGFYDLNGREVQDFETEQDEIHRGLASAIMDQDGPAARAWVNRHADLEEKTIRYYYGS